MSLTIVAFVDLQLKDMSYWKEGVYYKEEGVLEAIKDHAEIHLVAIDGTFRQLFFSRDAVIRVVGNVIWFNSRDSDYLITDHRQKFSEGK